jgi:RNA-binding protein 39
VLTPPLSPSSIGYVELRDEECVYRALGLSGTKLFGLPIMVQLTEAARNRGEGASTAQAPIRPNAGDSGSMSVPVIDPSVLANIPLPPHYSAGNPIHLAGISPSALARGSHHNAHARIFVGKLHPEITDADLRNVFDPFGTIENVDLPREADGKSKCFAFVQYRNGADAERAIQHMDNFELAGSAIKVGHVNARAMGTNSQMLEAMSGHNAQTTSSFDEGGGGACRGAALPLPQLTLLSQVA